MTYKDFGHYDKRNVLMKFLSNKETLRFISSNKKIKNSILSNTLSMSHDRYNKKNNDRNYKTRHSLDVKKENLFYK